MLLLLLLLLKHDAFQGTIIISHQTENEHHHPQKGQKMPKAKDMGEFPEGYVLTRIIKYGSPRRLQALAFSKRCERALGTSSSRK